ncbi:hypothetical protein AB0C74_12020 [Spirillospora sp. NPDC048832]
MRADFGLDQPLWQQYLTHMGEVLRGDFGDSWRLGGGAMAATLERFPATLALVRGERVERAAPGEGGGRPGRRGGLE